MPVLNYFNGVITMNYYVIFLVGVHKKQFIWYLTNNNMSFRYINVSVVVT